MVLLSCKDVSGRGDFGKWLEENLKQVKIRVAMSAEGKNLPAADLATFLLHQPRGFRVGAIRAIEVVELALQGLGRDVYVCAEQVVNRLKSLGFSSIRKVEWTQEIVRSSLPTEITS